MLEISSFQIETTPSLRPKISVWLNVTEDHLDWHGSFEKYAAAKAKMMQATVTDGAVIYNADDPLVAHLMKQSAVRALPFSVQRQLPFGGWIDNGYLCCSVGRGEERVRYPLQGLSLTGIHNWQNMLAAILSASVAGLTPQQIQKGLESFRGLPHRMQGVADIQGVHYINDSKATNIGAVEKALESVAAPIVWIAGGRYKGGSYLPL